MNGITDGYLFEVKNPTGDVESLVIDARAVDSISVIYKWLGNLVGAFEIWTTNDEDPTEQPIGWWETAATFTTNPAGTPGTAGQSINTPNKYYKIRFDRTSGTAPTALYMSLSVKKRPKEY